ncbi:hypothetical protein OOK41_03830 [Micromonospora sp. NBC_01655]|uniref:hypothetical protein n=1 Tax=Micromonospora sp. NBC_01655 TaxID=2975983 RepID=UPI0022578AEA|nr:hypothetical protein [Micromonospora sp. NBC_01655]MCX4469441.1 hypothetical protein [Micromonospora sp. NBC_01655]
MLSVLTVALLPSMVAVCVRRFVTFASSAVTVSVAISSTLTPDPRPVMVAVPHFSPSSMLSVPRMVTVVAAAMLPEALFASMVTVPQLPSMTGVASSAWIVMFSPSSQWLRLTGPARTTCGWASLA